MSCGNFIKKFFRSYVRVTLSIKENLRRITSLPLAEREFSIT